MDTSASVVLRLWIAVVCFAAPVAAQAVEQADSVTATVDRLFDELDLRGRSDVARELDTSLAKHDVGKLPPNLRLDIARLQLSLRGLAAATPLIRTAFADLNVRAEMPAWSRFDNATLERIAFGFAATDRVSDALKAMTWCCGYARNRHARNRHARRPCRPTMVARALADLAYFDAAIDVMRVCRGPRGDIDHALDMAQVLASAGKHELQLTDLQALMAQLANDAKTMPDGRLVDARTDALRSLGRYDDALDRIEELYSKHPTYPGIVARYHHAFGNYEGASNRHNGPYDAYRKRRQAILDRAEQHPEDALANYIAALDAYKDARYEEVDALLARVAKFAPGDARPILMRGFVALWRGDPVLARRLADEAGKLDSNEGGIPYLRSHIARHDDDLPAAVKELERFFAKRRDRKTIRYRRKKNRVLGELHMLRRGEKPEPIDRPDHPASRYHPNSLHEPFELPSPPVLLGAFGALLLAFGVGFRWSRRAG